MKQSKNEDYMSTDKRVEMLEITVASINANLSNLSKNMDLMRQEIGGMRQEMRQEIGEVRQEMRQEIGGMRQEIGGIRQEMGGMRQEMGGMRQEMHQRFDKVNDRLWNNFFWTIGAITALAGFMAHLHHLI